MSRFKLQSTYDQIHSLWKRDKQKLLVQNAKIREPVIKRRVKLQKTVEFNNIKLILFALYTFAKYKVMSYYTKVNKSFHKLDG